MNTENTTYNLDLLTISQVAELLNLKDNESAKKWLKKNGIKTYKFSKCLFVYKIEIAAAIDRPFVINLRNKFPDRWKSRYRDVVKDLAVFNLLVSEIEESPTPIPCVRPKLINKKDEKRYKQLLG